jgi:outer membrane protein TolC
VAEVDLMRVKVRLADIKQQLIKERNRLAIQKRTLGTLLGIEEESVRVAGQLEQPASVPATQPMTEKAMARRADYQAAAAAVEAGRHRIDTAKGARWPQIYAQGAYGGRYGIDADRPGGTNELEDVGSVGIVATIPLLDGGEIDADVLRQRFAVAKQRQQLRQQKLQIGLEVETAWRNIQSAVERIEATSAAVQQAKESLRIERQKYDEGEGTIVDVLDAQAALLEAQTNYYRALGDRDTARTQLKLATGELP